MKGRNLTTVQVGKLLQVDPSTVSRWIDAGAMVGFSTPGGHRRISESDLVHFLRERKMPVPEQLGGNGTVPTECQHANLTSSVRGLTATCQACGERFKLTKYA